MSLAESKIKLIQRIANLQDNSIVNKIEKLINEELGEEIYTLSDDEKTRIKEGKEEYKNGKTLSEKEANSEIDRWLNEE